jgi:hypothetical protein
MNCAKVNLSEKIADSKGKELPSCYKRNTVGTGKEIPAKVELFHLGTVLAM